jgi:hypothetical protein
MRNLLDADCPIAALTREWRDGRLVSVTYGPTLRPLSHSFCPSDLVWCSNRPDDKPGEVPAFALTGAELQSLRRQQASFRIHEEDGSALID